MNYVLGFMFSPDAELVALICKDKPAWQKGALNGIGGKIEEGETPIEAMVREFEEETGCKTSKEQWNYYALMTGNNDGGEGGFLCHCFAAIGNMRWLKTVDENEPVCIVPWKGLVGSRRKMLDNLPWIVPLGMAYLRNGRPGFVTIDYP